MSCPQCFACCKTVGKKKQEEASKKLKKKRSTQIGRLNLPYSIEMATNNSFDLNYSISSSRRTVVEITQQHAAMPR